MSILALGIGCASQEETPDAPIKADLITDIRSEYLDADRLTDSDVTNLGDGRTDIEKNIIGIFQKDLQDDTIDVFEEADLIQLGVPEASLAAEEDWQQPWLKQFGPLVTDVSVWQEPKLWSQSFNNKDYQRTLLLEMGNIDFKAVPADMRLTMATQAYAWFLSTPKEKYQDSNYQYYGDSVGFRDKDALRAFVKILKSCDRDAIPLFVEILKNPYPPGYEFITNPGDEVPIKDSAFYAIIERWSEIATPEDLPYATVIKKSFKRANFIFHNDTKIYDLKENSVSTFAPTVELFKKMGAEWPGNFYE